MMSLQEAATAMGAQLFGASALRLSGVSIDSRTLAAGELFFALPGPRFDGHDHVGQAEARGAVAAVVSRKLEGGLPQLLVKQTAQALMDLAASWRARYSLPVVAVTGSSGKTTVKDMLAVVLQQVGAVLATRGNQNNHLGVPLSLLRIAAHHWAAVLEMGMSRPGEIARLSALAKPEIGVITNAGPAHLEGLGSVAAVARAKGELAQGTSRVLVLNRDDAHFPTWSGLAKGLKVVGFGFSQEAQVRADYRLAEGHSDLRITTPAGELQARLPLAGKHNVANALAAVAAAVELGVPLALIRQGLEQVKPIPGRLLSLPGLGGARVIDDSYNANPQSVRAAISVLAACQSPRVFVLGDLAELGAEAAALHRELGREMAAAGIDKLFTLGGQAALAAEAFGAEARHADSMPGLIEAVLACLGPGVTVLVKGSRSAGMERLVQAITVVGAS